MRIVELRVQKDVTPLNQPCDKVGQRNLGCVCRPREHALPEEDAAERDAIEEKARQTKPDDKAAQAELDRARIGMKSRLVMQGESTGSRASAIAADLYVHGRPRTLDQLADRVDSATLDKVNAYLAENKPGPMTLATIGPQPLVVK